MIKIAVAGAEGRMGRLITELVQADPLMSLTACLTRATYPVFPEIPFQVLIDFSARDAVLEHAKSCSDRKIAMVIGVTGLLPEQIANLHSLAKKIPILLSPNMSLGINLSFKLLEIITQWLTAKEEAIEVAITETHHRHKKDAPSGTAKQMGEIVVRERKNALSTPAVQFSSLRLGEVMGEHRAIFALAGEQLEITHIASDRIIFAKGALMAAKWIKDKPPGIYDMQDVLDL